MYLLIRVLTKWWAQYMESTGDMETAMRHYTEAGDSLSMVRVMCFLEDYDRAADIANGSVYVYIFLVTFKNLFLFWLGILKIL